MPWGIDKKIPIPVEQSNREARRRIYRSINSPKRDARGKNQQWADVDGEWCTIFVGVLGAEDAVAEAEDGVETHCYLREMADVFGAHELAGFEVLDLE